MHRPRSISENSKNNHVYWKDACDFIFDDNVVFRFYYIGSGFNAKTLGFRHVLTYY